MRDQRGFTLVELIVTAGILGLLAAVAIGISGSVIQMTRGESGAAQLDGFLKRQRQTAVSRRRDIEIRFEPPNRVQSLLRPGLGDTSATPQPLDNLTLEGGITFRVFPGMPDTPNGFGHASAIALGGLTPVMFASEGVFMDVAANPINATLSLGADQDPLTATAVTILGTTATVERWRWNGAAWTR